MMAHLTDKAGMCCPHPRDCNTRDGSEASLSGDEQRQLLQQLGEEESTPDTESSDGSDDLADVDSLMNDRVSTHLQNLQVRTQQQDSLTQHMALTETVLKQKQDLAAAVDKRAQLRQHLRACNNAIGQLDRMISNMELTTTHPSSARGNWCPDDRGRLGWLMVGEGELQLAIQQTYDIAEARQQVMMDIQHIRRVIASAQATAAAAVEQTVETWLDQQPVQHRHRELQKQLSDLQREVLWKKTDFRLEDAHCKYGCSLQEAELQDKILQQLQCRRGLQRQLDQQGQQEKGQEEEGQPGQRQEEEGHMGGGRRWRGLRQALSMWEGPKEEGQQEEMQQEEGQHEEGQQ